MEPVQSPKALWRSPKKLVGLILLVLLLIGARGLLFARMLDGNYQVQSFIFDAVAALLILVVLQLIDAGLSRFLKSVIGDRTRTQKFLIGVCRFAFVVLGFGTFLLAAVQMHPAKIACAKTPKDFGLEFTEHVLTTSDGIEISAWAIPADDPERPVVVVTHGLGANKQNFMFVSEQIHQMNFNVVAFDFRGHGNSGGHTCTLGVREAEDVKAAFDFAKRQFPNRPVFAWSTSLGAAATLRAAAEYQIFDRLVIDATFSSVKNLALDTKFCYLGPFGSTAWNISRVWYFAFVRTDIENYGPESDIVEINVPIFLIHGTADPIIPHTESEKLQAANPNAKLWLVKDAGHSMSFHDLRYPIRVLNFFDGK